jgi:iron complex outermembrane recepter protein
MPTKRDKSWICRGRAAVRVLCVMAVFCAPPRAASAQQTMPPPSVLELPTVEVVGVTPVLGTNVPIDQVPSNVQTVTAPQLENYHPWALPEALQNNLGSVSLSDTEGNPFQINLDFHGYTASPVLGTPQGLAIYQNGTRINEPFRDVVYWDFVPLFAIEKLQLIPGSNPVFGLNALGGAVTLQMKSGFDVAGLQTDMSAGSFDRQQAIAQYGVEKGDVAFYTGLMAANDGGWRDFSPSQVFQSYSDLEVRKGDLDLGASFTFANNHLAGNGAAPEQQLEITRAAAFAIPDTAHDHLAFLQGRGNYQATAALSFQGTVYFRNSEVYILNGAASGFGACQEPGDNFAQLCNNPGPGEAPLTGFAGNRSRRASAAPGSFPSKTRKPPATAAPCRRRCAIRSSASGTSPSSAPALMTDRRISSVPPSSAPSFISTRPGRRRSPAGCWWAARRSTSSSTPTTGITGSMATIRWR